MFIIITRLISISSGWRTPCSTIWLPFSAPHQALCWQLRAWSLLQILCLLLSLPLPHLCSVSIKNKCKKEAYCSVHTLDSWWSASIRGTRQSSWGSTCRSPCLWSLLTAVYGLWNHPRIRILKIDYCVACSVMCIALRTWSLLQILCFLLSLPLPHLCSAYLYQK